MFYRKFNDFNLFFPNTPFLYPLKTSLLFFWCYHYCYGASKTVMAEVVKGDERSLSKKYLRWPAQYIATDSQVQLLAFPWQSYLELARDGVKGK